MTLRTKNPVLERPTARSLQHRLALPWPTVRFLQHRLVLHRPTVRLLRPAPWIEGAGRCLNLRINDPVLKRPTARFLQHKLVLPWPTVRFVQPSRPTRKPRQDRHRSRTEPTTRGRPRSTSIRRSGPQAGTSQDPPRHPPATPRRRCPLSVRPCIGTGGSPAENMQPRIARSLLANTRAWPAFLPKPSTLSSLPRGLD